LQALLSHPAVQAGIAPLIVALVIAGLGHPLRLSGLAAAGGFFAAVYLIGNFALEPLTATRKIVLLGMAAPLIGLLADLAFKPTRMAGVVLGALFGLGAVWVFWTVLAQKPTAQAFLHGGAVAVFVMAVVAFTMALYADPVRAGAAGIGLGFGAGIGSVIGASALIGQYGIALGAASGGFVLLVMIAGNRLAAGATFVLTISVVSALLAAGAALLAKFPWYAAALLGLAPLAVRLPVPQPANPAVQTVVASIYSIAVAAGACALAWTTARAGN
jgi:hypothetical protein